MELEGHNSDTTLYKFASEDTAAPIIVSATGAAIAIAAAAALTTDIFLLMRCCGLKEISNRCEEHDDKGFSQP